MLNRLVSLCFGDIPKHKIGDLIIVCVVRGCMAERLDPEYTGVIEAKKRVKCHGINNADGKIPAIDVRVIDPMNTGGKAGQIKSELVCRMRQLKDGRLIICN